MVNVLALDLGATSGRAVVGRYNGENLSIEEVHRFANIPVQMGAHLYWDILRIYHEIKQSLYKSKRLGFNNLQSIAIDSWAVDFGLLDKSGELLSNPYHYRDDQTKGIMEEIFTLIPQREIFQRTGIQFMPINTLYHLYAMQKRQAPILTEADTFLMIPSLLRYFLTGEYKNEFTNATTTQMFSPKQGDWDDQLLKKLGLPREIFAEVVQPGTQVGILEKKLCHELGIPALPVIAVAEHDTASAVVSIPTEAKDFAYLSCGTWSLLGTEIRNPIVNEQSLRWNFTNEGGMNQTYRLLKNIMGLWLVEECKRVWQTEGKTFSYEQLLNEAEQAPAFRSLIDPDDAMFSHPEHMPRALQSYCRQTGQSIPVTPGEIMRCILESLAFKYRLVWERTRLLSGKSFAGLHMVGGGIHNTTLCQYTANAVGYPVWAGPSEGTAIGNILVQLITLGYLSDLSTARQVVKRSFPIQTYMPQETDRWEQAYERFLKITGL